MTLRLTNPFFFVPDANGEPVPGGLVYTYVAGTLTPQASYLDTNGTANTNPVVLDSSGKGVIVLDGEYRIIMTDSEGNPIFDQDNISSEEVEEFINCRDATFVSGTTFTMVGDQTSNYQVDRAVKIDNNPAIAYSLADSVSYSGGTDTTTVVLADSIVTSGVVSACTSIVGPNSLVTSKLIADLAAASGGATIGVTGGITLQAKLDAIDTSISALDYQPYSATVDVPVGGRRTGSDGNLYHALIANGPSTTVVDPVGDVTGTWELEQQNEIEVPVGCILPWPTATPPTGWFECDGSAFSLTTYPELAAVYPSANLPDMRGEFVRGWDNGRGADAQAGRVILTTQTHQFDSHTHAVSNMNELETGAGSFTQGGGGAGQGSLNTDSAGGGETRPRNVAFMYIVRAR